MRAAGMVPVVCLTTTQLRFAWVAASACGKQHMWGGWHSLKRAMVLPVRVKTPRAPLLWVCILFWMALTRRPAPALTAPEDIPSARGDRSEKVSVTTCSLFFAAMIMIGGRRGGMRPEMRLEVGECVGNS